MKRFFAPALMFIASIFFFNNCGKSDGQSNKAYSSVWVSTVNGSTLDLTGVSIGSTNTVTLFLDDTTACGCYVTTSGGETSGTYNVYACTLTHGPGNQSDCALHDGHGTYAISGSTLTMCNSASPACSTFH